LLLEYFRFYCWKFDARHDIVSIHRVPPQTSNTTATSSSAVLPEHTNQTRLDKAEHSGGISWCNTSHDTFAIEDPFEHDYDVAHVIRPAQMKYIRKEYLVSHFFPSTLMIYTDDVYLACVDTLLSPLLST
jgi:hypothetical protein